MDCFEYCNKLFSQLSNNQQRRFENYSITIEFIEAHPEKDWNWYSISCNKFDKHFEQYKRFPCYKNFPIIKKRRKEKLEKMRTLLRPYFGDPSEIVSEFIVAY